MFFSVPNFGDSPFRLLFVLIVVILCATILANALAAISTLLLIARTKQLQKKVARHD